jgi:sugar phosphate isomerase/epimerase
MRAAGFDCADLSAICDICGPYYTSDLQTAKEMAKKERKAAAAAGIRIHQVHGPWPTDDKTAKKRKEKLIYMERAIRLTPVFGARYLIIHPDMPFGWDDEPEPAFSWQTNLDLFRAMLPIAEEEGVILCIENMPMKAHAISRTQRMYEFVQEINHPNLGMCLDTGHANVFADDCGDMVRLIAPVLKTLHVHDNMGDKDSHLPPYKGTINWERFTSALREIGFAGVLSIEATLAVRDKTQEGRAEAARCMAEIARKLADAAS